MAALALLILALALVGSHGGLYFRPPAGSLFSDPRLAPLDDDYDSDLVAIIEKKSGNVHVEEHDICIATSTTKVLIDDRSITNVSGCHLNVEALKKIVMKHETEEKSIIIIDLFKSFVHCKPNHLSRTNERKIHTNCVAYMPYLSHPLHAAQTGRRNTIAEDKDWDFGSDNDYSLQKDLFKNFG